MAGKQNGRAEGLYRTLGWSRYFPRACGEPLKSIGAGEGCFKTLTEHCENFWAGVLKRVNIY